MRSTLRAVSVKDSWPLLLALPLGRFCLGQFQSAIISPEGAFLSKARASQSECSER